MITGVWTVDVGGEGSGVDVDGVSFNLSLWLRQSTVSCLDSSKTELFKVYIYIMFPPFKAYFLPKTFTNSLEATEVSTAMGWMR